MTVVALSCATALAQDSAPANRLVIQADQGKQTIRRNIYGHFSEHLGRCIYEGIWVGEGSSIPNTRGIRNDVVAALKQIKVPVLRWPGGCFADELKRLESWQWDLGRGQGGDTSKSRQILRAVRSFTSRWRGMLETFRLLGFHQIV